MYCCGLWNRRNYINFLNENLKSHKAIFYKFIVLSLMKYFTLCCIFAIVHFCIVVPMRWLAGNTHHLGAQDWSNQFTGRAVDTLHDAAIEIKDNGSLFLNEQFMMCISK